MINSDNKPDKIPEKNAVKDRGETVSLMEPLLLSQDSRFRSELTDLAFELGTRSTGFRQSLPPALSSALSHLVRAMNCYYSNLIEGHNTHPVDIERALEGDYSTDPKKRDLQLEAKAHIEVQAWIDGGGLKGRSATTQAVLEIHQRFCAELPESLLWVESPHSHKSIRVEPGKLREDDVVVGRHKPISPGAIPRFMQRFETVYGPLGRAEGVLAAAAMHHRLLWIHPFLDGNGRVARLMSHASLLDLMCTGGVWSIVRGLARNVGRYKELLSNCDLGRRNDLDGRGNLSEEALVEFTRFYLETCLDQVAFMEDLMQPAELEARIMVWAEEEIRLGRLPTRARQLLETLLYRGELSRGEVAGILDTGDRNARRVTSELTTLGVITSESSKSALKLAFPASLASRWMPGLFPPKQAEGA